MSARLSPSRWRLVCRAPRARRCSIAAAATCPSRSCTRSAADPSTMPDMPSTPTAGYERRSSGWGWIVPVESFVGVDVGGGGIRVRALLRDVLVKARSRGAVARREGRIDVACLLYTSDAADEEDSVDLGG